MILVFLTGKDYMWGCGQIGKKCEGAYHFTIFPIEYVHVSRISLYMV